MSTYNGEKFLAEQIESIQAQSFTDWELLIRDDGSIDGTVALIDRFVRSDSRIHRLESEGNLGSIDSFFRLLKAGTADFYFFSDQDDVWLPEKLQRLLDTARTHDNSKPILYYSDLKVVDQQLSVMSESMIRSQSDHPNTQLVQELTENTVTGCTAMINHSLAQLWQDTDGLLMHDWWLALLASALGELVYINEPLVLYRQHMANVLGARTLSKRMRNWFGHWFRKYWWLISASQKQAEKLLTYDLTEADRQLVTAFVGILEQSGRSQILQKYQLRKNKSFHTFVFRTLIRTKFAYKGGNTARKAKSQS